MIEKEGQSMSGQQHQKNLESDDSMQLILSNEKEVAYSINHEPEFVSATILLNQKIKKLPCLVDPILPKVGVVALGGSSDAGKSTILRQLALSVVLDEPEFIGFPLNCSSNKAVYISSEDDEYGVGFLLNKYNDQKGVDPKAYEGLKFIFNTEFLVPRLDKLLEKDKPDLVIVDAFGDLYGKSMNETNQVRNFIQEFSQLAQKYKCLIIFLHHTGKATDERVPSKHNLLGSQGFEAKMRLVIELRVDKVNPELRHFCIVKGNYLPKEFKNESYVLKFDENMIYTNTGNRVPFEDLTSAERILKSNNIEELKKEGKTQKAIAMALGISQSTVSRELKSK